MAQRHGITFADAPDESPWETEEGVAVIMSVAGFELQLSLLRVIPKEAGS
jgi:hypothetical protein